jgi:hypothetical protein
MPLEAATKTTGRSVVLGKSSYQALVALPPLPFQRVEVKVKGHDEPVSAWGISFPDLKAFLDLVDEARVEAAPTPS